MLSNSSKFDQIDRKILKELAADGRIPVVDLAEKVGLSISPCRMRVKKLENQGYLLGYHARLNYAKLGLDHITFIEVKLEHTDKRSLAKFRDAVLKITEIEEVHMIAGSFDYLLKLRTQNMARYHEIHSELISNLPGVISTSTNVVMAAVKE